MLMHYAENVYLNTNEHDRSIAMGEATEVKFARKVMTDFPLHKYERSAPILHDLRVAKSKYEVDLLGKAIDITNKGFQRVLKFIKPGVWEYEIEAELTHEYVINRGTGHAYEPIVATGKNACVLHYISNEAQCKAGELVLMDCAAEYANYNAHHLVEICFYSAYAAIADAITHIEAQRRHDGKYTYKKYNMLGFKFVLHQYAS